MLDPLFSRSVIGLSLLSGLLLWSWFGIPNTQQQQAPPVEDIWIAEWTARSSTVITMPLTTVGPVDIHKCNPICPDGVGSAMQHCLLQAGEEGVCAVTYIGPIGPNAGCGSCCVRYFDEDGNCDPVWGRGYRRFHNNDLGSDASDPVPHGVNEGSD
jgi:hypothetical protein